MKRSVFLLFLAGLILQCSDKPERIQIPVKGYEGVAEKLTEAILYEIEDKDLNSISIAVLDKGRIVWANGFGLEDKENKTEADASTIYRVGSVSELFTDIAIMQCVENGELDPDVPVSNYLPQFAPENPYDMAITLRHLMTHRSGLLREPGAGHYFDDSNPTLKKTVESISNSTLIYPPGEKTKYSNAAIAVAGYLLEEKYNQSYSSIIQDNILNPIGMQNSAFMLNSNLNKDWLMQRCGVMTAGSLKPRCSNWG